MLPDIHNLREHVRSLPVSPKRIISYESSFDLSPQERITFEHTQNGGAIKTTSLLGFMLRDLQNEFCSRFTDELQGTDKHAKPIGDPNIANRAKLGAHIGEGNKHFQKYSMTGKVYLILLKYLMKPRGLP
jgi:hypothetical protein